MHLNKVLLFLITFFTLNAHGTKPLETKNFYIVNNIQPEIKTLELNGHKKNYKIQTYFYNNNDSKKIMLIVHGYLDNCSYMYYLNKLIIKNEYSILCVELPGHGNSSGTRAHIDNIKTYGNIIQTLDLKKNYPNKSFSYIAHSTGALPYLEHKLNGLNDQFEKVILLAPLIRSKYWYPSKLGIGIAKLFSDKINRKKKKNIKFNTIAYNDKNYISYMYYPWFDKLVAWNKDIDTIKTQFKRENVYLFFSEFDEVIDTDFNETRYKKFFPNANMTKLKGATHHMDYDPEEISKSFFTKLDSIL